MPVRPSGGVSALAHVSDRRPRAEVWYPPASLRGESVALRRSATVARRGLRQPAVQALAKLVGIVVSARSPLARDDDAGRRDTCDTG
jgi:hypothetical protein